MIDPGRRHLWDWAILPGKVNSVTALGAFAERMRERPYFAETGLFLLALLPLLSTPVLPLIDFYNHLARFFVLSHLGRDFPLRNAYEAHWSILPNIGTDVFATPLLRFVPPLLAAKLIVVLILATMFSGILYFHRAMTGRRSLLVAVAILPLLYSYVLNWGFANFLFGLGMVFWAAGWWLFCRNRPYLRMPIACLWALLIFFAHGVAFALYCLLLIALEVGLYLARPDRRFADLVSGLCQVIGQAVIPVAIFLVWQTREASSVANIFAPALSAQPPLAHNGLHRLSAILRVEEGPAYWLDIVTLVAQAAILCFLVWRGCVRVVKEAWPLLALGAILMAAVPSEILGVYYISDRTPLFAALCLLGALLVSAHNWTRDTKAAAALLVIIAFGRIGAIAADWRGYTERFREFETLASHIPPGVPTLDVMVGSGHHETGVSRCEMYGPLLVSLHGQFVPLFTDPNQQPLLLIGVLGRARDRLRRLMPLPDERTKDYNPYIQAAASAGYDQFLVCGADRLLRPFPPNFVIVAHTQHSTALRALH